MSSTFRTLEKEEGRGQEVRGERGRKRGQRLGRHKVCDMALVGRQGLGAWRGRQRRDGECDTRISE